MQFQSSLWMPRRGPGITNAARFAAVIGLGVVTAIPVSAQTVEVQPCPDGASGPVAGDPTPFPGGMCKINTPGIDSDSRTGRRSSALGVSADGAVVVGWYRPRYSARAFRWDRITGEMLSLGTLWEDGTIGGSAAVAVSADGNVLVGVASTNRRERHAFRWDAISRRKTSLGTLRDFDKGTSYASAVSADGRVVVGTTEIEASYIYGADPEHDVEGEDTNYRHAFRWDEASGQMVDLGTVSSDNLGDSSASAVSADGSVVIGTAEIDASYAIGYTTEAFQRRQERAFRWDEASGQMIDLGTLREDNRGHSTAIAISADGSVVVGHSSTERSTSIFPRTDFDERQAFRWDSTSGQMVGLGTFRADGSGYSYANAVSADGSVVVGRASSDSGSARAYRWINGSMVDLGTLREGNVGRSSATHVSADGSVVVGTAETDLPASWGNYSHAFHWDADSGKMIDLGTLRADNSGWSQPLAVSADGSVVVGLAVSDSNQERAFIWRSAVDDFRTSVLQDYENLLLSYGQLANDTELAVSQQQMAVDRLMAQGCFAAGGASCFGIGGDLTRTANSSETGDNARGNATVSLHFGHGLNDHLTLGGTVALGGTQLGSNAFDMDRTAAVSLWADFSQGGAARTGLQMHAAVGWAEETGSVVRGRGLQGVTQAGGEANVITKAVEASVAYGIAQNSWLITPKLSVAHFRTSRSAHVDAGSDFGGRYDALSVSRTVARLSVTGERDLSDKDHLSLSVGVARDLDNDRVSLTGMSELANMDTLAIDSTLKRNEVRSFAEARYTHDLGRDRSVTGSLRVGEALYGDVPQVGLGIMYNVAF